MAVTQYIGARYVPLIDGDWTRAKSYEPLTVVLHQGNSYTSRQAVPKGVDIADTRFWALTGNYNAQVEMYRREAQQAVRDIEIEKSRAQAVEAALDSQIEQVRETYVKSFNTVVEMKSAHLVAGMVCHTNGFYSADDGGSAWYVIANEGVANEMDIIACNGSLVATLLIGKAITPNMLGAKGQTGVDDYDNIARALEIAINSRIPLELVDMYEVSKPLKVTDTVHIQGQGNATGLIKTTTIQGQITDSRDAVILVDGNTMSPGTLGEWSYGHVFKDFDIVGCVDSYVAGKTDSTMQYAFYSKNGIIKSIIHNINIRHVDVGIQSRKFWNSTLSDCRRISAHYDGVCFDSEMQGAVVTGNNTLGTHRYGYKFAGASYADISGNLAEWLYGGRAYHMTSCSALLNGCGYELGDGAEIGFDIQNSNVEIIGAYMDTPLENGTCVNANGSNVAIKDSQFGLFVGGKVPVNAKVFRGNNATITVNNCKCNKIFSVVSDFTNTIVSVDGTMFDNTQCKSGFAINRDVNDFNADYNIPFRGHSPKVLRLGLTGYQKSYGDNLEWNKSVPKGSIGFSDNSFATGVAGYITAHNNNENVTSAGTISEVGSNYLKFTNNFLTEYGERFPRKQNIKGDTSGATATLENIDNSGKQYISNVTGTFQVGETVTTQKSTNIRNGSYVPISATVSGVSILRPTSPENGVCYFDTTLGKPVWWNGSKWVDANGADA